MEFASTPQGFFLIQGVLILGSVLALLWSARPGGSPLALLREGAGAALATRAGRLGLLALAVTGVIGWFFNKVDPWFTQLALGIHGVEDFAAWIYALEGGATRHLQLWAPTPLVAFFLYVYVCLFPALVLTTLLGIHALGRTRAVAAGVVALILNQLLAMPFFLFFTVRETWYSTVAAPDAKARLLLEDLGPAIEPLFRDFRGIENNFPSLHTGVSVTFALLAWRCGDTRLAAVVGSGASLVIFSTFYLGFHWFTDAVAGAFHAWLCVTLAMRLTGAETR